MFRRKKEPSEAQKAKDAREKKKLALFLTPNPPTPPLKKRTTRQPLKQGNAVLPRGVENDFAKDSESSSETSSASSDTSTSGSSSDKSEEAPASSLTPDSSPEARAQAPPLKSSLKSLENPEVLHVLSNPGQQESASNKIVKKSNLKESIKKKTKRPPCQVHGVQRRSSRLRKHNEKADKSASDSVEECNLATPFIWTMEMLQKLMQYCAAEPH
ncbi:nucleolar and coiled-body phosphoprotein 1-like isoform X1 [Dermacentor albipictus]|uniref:nucleolar and coiled-body phosphoprotein 1-like isoform X1 n=2 Tax=Dermacentor albipictus TaxID=60249 RepID=UPI0031FDF024